MAEPTYYIRRFYMDDTHLNHGTVVKTGLTLKEAQAHCQDEATHEYDEDGEVVWFDGYDKEN